MELPNALGKRRESSGLMPGRQPQMMPTFVSTQARTKMTAPSPVFVRDRSQGQGWVGLTVDIGAVEVAVEVVDAEDAGDEDAATVRGEDDEAATRTLRGR